MPTEIHSEIFSNFLCLEDICRFDSALCNKNKRSLYLECIGSESCIWQGDDHRNFNSNAISWLQTRSIKVRHLKCNEITDVIAVKIGSFGSCLHWLSIRCCKDTVDERMDGIFVTMIDGCPNLQSVELSNCRGTSDDTIIMLAERCQHLRSLHLTGNISKLNRFQITDRGIERLAEVHPNLDSLTLEQCYHITDISIKKVAEKCPKLNSLNLRSCINITDASIVRLSKGCPHLHSLHLSDCDKITDLSIIKVAEKYPHLHTLNLRRMRNITDRSIIMVGDSCPNLCNLHLQACENITDLSIIRIAEGCPDLRSLNFSGENLNSIATDVSVIRLADKCPKLNSLNLRGCINITDASIVRLSKGCPDIHTLQTYKCQGVTMKLKKLKEIFPNLKCFI
jgi:hypothetical protein